MASKGREGSKAGFLADGNRNAIVALLALAALAVIAYVLLSSQSQTGDQAQAGDLPSDGSEFYRLLSGSSKVGLLYDARQASLEQRSAIFQCGVDIISKGRFVGKEISIAACDEKECLSVSSSKNGTRTIDFESAQSEMLSSMPYILIKPPLGNGSGYAFFKRHMEIYLAEGASGACDISATES